MEFYPSKTLENHCSIVSTTAFFIGGMTYSREALPGPRLADSWSIARLAQYHSQAHPEMWFYFQMDKLQLEVQK